MTKNLTTHFSLFLAGLVMFGLFACATSTTEQENKTEGFAIYLLAQNIAADEILKADIDNLELDTHPVLSSKDILAYSKDTHEIELTPSAYKRIGELQVPTSGMPFVVCVNRQPIYGGAFWVGYSSMSFQGIAIDILYAQQNRPIKIQLGYPESPELFVGDDSRSEIRILQSLEQEGKLK